MVVSAMTLGTDRPEPHPRGRLACETEAEGPLDFLVNALDRAVARKRATGTKETEHRT
jgi:hypothetical protein